jgi:bifunctional DNA-binding transcriptional regulator/antitoxin component of YhaV-PrlF toxin-antitoxin module
MSSHHQVAVPRAVAAASGISPGDRFRVESSGRGRFVLTRIDEYIAQLELPEKDRGPAD